MEQKKTWTIGQMLSAHSEVAKAITAELLSKQPCVICSNDKAEAHHEDYDDPLNVVWLCKAHHEMRHKEIGYALVEYRKAEIAPQAPLDIKHCNRCNRDWCFRGTGEPLRCGKCKSPYWRKHGNDDIRAAGGSSAGEVVGSGNDAVVPVLRNAKSATKRLRSLHPVRNELASRGGSEPRSSFKSHTNHSVYRYGNVMFCATCNVEYQR